MPENVTPRAAEGQAVESQAQEQTGQRQVTLRVDERNMSTSYANAFRSNGTAEEVMLDFGLNIAMPQREGGQAEILFQVTNRVVMNYHSAKRLAISLSQIVRSHENQFGDLELDVTKRQKKA